MKESEFIELTDRLLVLIESAVETSGAEIDTDPADGVLELSFDDDSRIIINRQTSIQQIWVATPTGGFHYDYDEAGARWLSDDDGEELFEALSRFCSEQSGEPVRLLPRP